MRVRKNGVYLAVCAAARTFEGCPRVYQPQKHKNQKLKTRDPQKKHKEKKKKKKKKKHPHNPPPPPKNQKKKNTKHHPHKTKKKNNKKPTKKKKKNPPKNQREPVYKSQPFFMVRGKIGHVGLFKEGVILSSWDLYQVDLPEEGNAGEKT